MEPGAVGISLLRGVGIGALGFVVLAVAPLPSGPLGPIDVLLAVAGVAILAGSVVAAAIHERRAEQSSDPASAQGARLESLLANVLLAVAFFSLVYARLATVPGEFVGLATRLDAVYFTVSTLSTVGFGDIHAAGQTSRLAVIVQMVFNAVVVAAAIRLVFHAARRRRPPAKR